MIYNTPLGVAVRHIQRAEQIYIDQLECFGSATVHEAQLRVGQLKPYLRPIYQGSAIAGSAITVLLQPGDNWMLHVAMELAEPGDIIMAACTADNDDGFFGDLLASSAKAQGVKGLIIDGGVRDVAELQAMDFPVWSKSISIKGTVKATLGSVNIPIVCAGQIINPGDVVVADDDGVCVVSRVNAEVVASSAQKRLNNETAKRAQFASGVLGLDLYAMRESLAKAGLRYFDSLDDLQQD